MTCQFCGQNHYAANCPKRENEMTDETKGRAAELVSNHTWDSDVDMMVAETLIRQRESELTKENALAVAAVREADIQSVCLFCRHLEDYPISHNADPVFPKWVHTITYHEHLKDKPSETITTTKPCKASNIRSSNLDHASAIAEIERRAIKPYWRFIDKEVMPRYVEMFVAAGLGNPNTSVVVELAKALQPKEAEDES